MKKGQRNGLLNKYWPPLLAILILFSISGYAQTYNPAIHVVTNDAISPAQATPTDSRSMFYDPVNFLYRPYQNQAEVYSYLNLSKYRTGNFLIVIDSGGTLQSNGTYLNGTNTIWMFRDSTSNAGLLKLNIFNSSVCSGCLLAANNLSDVANAGTARSNLGLGTMATQSTTALGTDITGIWPGALTVNSIQGHNLSYIQNYANLTNTPPGLSLTTIGTSGVATYNSGTGVLNIPNYSGSGGSCLNCNADTIGNIPLNFTTFPNGSVLTLDSAAGYAYWAPASGGIATLPPNIGIGYTIYAPQVPGFRTLICNSGCTIDSTTNTGSLTFNITGGSTGTVTAFTAGNLSPIFTTSVVNGTTTPALSFILNNAPAYNVLINNTASPAPPVYAAPTSTIMDAWFGTTIASVPSAGLVYSNGTILGDVTVNAPLIYSLGVLSADTLSGSQNLATQGWVTRNTANTVSNSDGTLTISPTTGAVIASLNQGHNFTLTGNNTLNGITTFGAGVAFSTSNTYSIGGSTDVAAHMWSRVFNSDAAASLSSTTGNPVSLDIGTNAGITLLSTGQAEFNNYTGSGFSGTSSDSILTINPATGAIGWRWGQPFYIYAVQGTSPVGTHGDSIELGGSYGTFFQADTIITAGFAFSITGLPDKSTLLSTDSVLIETLAGQLYKVPSSAIGGGGSQTFQQVLTTGSTLTGANTVTMGANNFTWSGTGTMAINSPLSTNSTVNLTGITTTSGTSSMDVMVMDTITARVWKQKYYPFDTAGYAKGSTILSFNGSQIGLSTSGGGGGIGMDSTVVITSGSSSTVTNGYNIVYFNPSSTMSSYTLTLPTTWHSSNNLIISFSPTAFTSGTVVTSLTIIGGSGQTLAQYYTPINAQWGSSLEYHLINGAIDQLVN